jgi:hypothetical protein
VFVDINENQASVDKNLLWDLYDDLYEGSDVEKQCERRTISRIAKILNREGWSPFCGKVHIPGEGNADAPLNMRSLCHTIEKHRLVDRVTGRLYYQDWDQTVEFAARRIAAFYDVFKRAMPAQWEMGDQHFICTKAGFISLTGILHDLVQQNISSHKLHSLPKYKAELAAVLKPAVRHLQEASDAQVKSYRATGGAEAGARAVRAALTEMLEIQSDFLEAWHNTQAVDPVNASTLIPYLQGGENENVEFKASARLNVRKFLHTGAKENSADLAKEGFLKAVVGFLNAGGGEVILGVMESREADGVEEAVLEGFPVLEQHYVVGAQLEYDGSGADGYERMLRALVLEHIGTQVIAGGLVKMRRLDSYESKDVWVITVDRAGRRQYLDGEHFYVRLGNETQVLSGPDADEYWETRNG